MRIEDTCKRKLRLAIRVAERFHRRRTKGKGRKHVRLLEIHRRRKSKAGDRFCTYLYKGHSNHVYMLDGQADSRGVGGFLDKSRYL
jgi:hypothetical protein